MDDQQVTQTEAQEAPDTQPEQQSAETSGISQDEVNRLIGKTRTEARQKALNGLLSDLGVEDVDTLKSALAQFTELKQAQMSELERAQAQNAELQKQLEAQRAEIEQQRQAQQAQRVNDAIRTAAEAAKAKDASDVVLWAASKDLASLIGENGAIDTEAVSKLVQDAQKAKPHYFGVETAGSPSNSNAKKPASKKFEFTPQERRKFGI